MTLRDFIKGKVFAKFYVGISNGSAVAALIDGQTYTQAWTANAGGIVINDVKSLRKIVKL